MRMLMKVMMPTEKFNEAVRDGSAGRKIGRMLEELRPEAVYFTEEDGCRQGLFIINVDEPSKVPVLAEPWFLAFNADVRFRIVMSPEELRRSGLEDLGRKWGNI